MIGLFGDGSVWIPSVPVQIGDAGTVHHTDGQDAAWQALVLMLGLALILGSAVVIYVVVQRTRVLARRRARAASAMRGSGTDAGAAEPEPEQHGDEAHESHQQWSPEPLSAPEPQPPQAPDEPLDADPRQARRPRVTA